MLRNIKTILGYKISAIDGDIGHVHDFYFDDFNWKLRYLVADTGNWMKENLVLVSTVALEQPDWQSRRFPIMLDRKSIETSPPVSKHEPVSVEREKEIAQYYRWPVYWPPVDLKPQYLSESDTMIAEQSHLRSINKVLDYNIHALDGKIGYVRDFIIDDQSWTIRYLVIDTKHFIPGNSVLVSPSWVQNVDWDNSQLDVDLDKKSIMDSPKYDPTKPVNEEYEMRLYDYYGRPVDWLH